MLFELSIILALVLLNGVFAAAEISVVSLRGSRLEAMAFLIEGQAPVREVNRKLDLDLPEGEGWSTVAGLCLELAGRIPAIGEVLRAPDGTTLEITDAIPRQVRMVRLRKRPAEEPAPEGKQPAAAGEGEA